MKHYEIRRIGENRGHRRIWLQGALPAKGGFAPGTKYSAKPVFDKSMLVLEVVENGLRVVSKKQRGEREVPVIDIESDELLKVFDGIESIRVVVQAGKIFILPVASELRAKERLARTRARIANGEAILTGSTSTGIGILDHAAHQGLENAGLKVKLAFANEIREDCMEHAVERNPIFDEETITLTAPMQELAFDPYAMEQLPQVDAFIAGIPCSGASVAGRTKGKLAHPEDHPDVGGLIAPFIAIVARIGASVVVLENVPPYRSSASMSILRNSLRDLGYDVHETELDASEWNMLEHRRRMCMVAVTKGIDFSFDSIQRPEPMSRRFGEIMDDVPPDHSTWGSIDYLWAKKDRDAAAGKGFAPTVVDTFSTKVPTLNKTLHKRQSTGTFIQHPTDEKKYRIPTVAEHARCKGVDEKLVQGTTQTFGHEALGQAISVPPFVSVFEALGKALKKCAEGVAQTVAFSPIRAAA